MSEAAHRHRKSLGVLMARPEDFDRYHVLGFRFIACGDGTLLTGAPAGRWSCSPTPEPAARNVLRLSRWTRASPRPPRRQRRDRRPPRGLARRRHAPRRPRGTGGRAAVAQGRPVRHRAGAPVVRYGTPIAFATGDIPRGSWSAKSGWPPRGARAGRAAPRHRRAAAPAATRRLHLRWLPQFRWNCRNAQYPGTHHDRAVRRPDGGVRRRANPSRTLPRYPGVDGVVALGTRTAAVWRSMLPARPSRSVRSVISL